MRSALWGRGVVMMGASLALFACGGSLVGPVPERLLSEAWEWQSACCGIAGDTRTPATEGYSYVLRFHEKGTVRAVRDGTLLNPLPLGPRIEPVSRHMLVILEDGRLLLSSLEGCADCFGDWEFLPRLETQSPSPPETP